MRVLRAAAVAAIVALTGTAAHAEAPAEPRPSAVPAAHGSAQAQARVEAPQPEDVVVVALVSPTTSPTLRTALSELQTQLARQGVTLLLRRTDLRADAPMPDARETIAIELSARGVFWFEESGPGVIGVYLRAADGQTFGRRVQVDADSPEASIEAVWLIVSGSALALAHGEAVHMHSVALPQSAGPQDDLPDPGPARLPSPTTTPRVPKQSTIAAHIAAGYLGDGLAPELTWQNGGFITASIDVRPWMRLGLGYGLLAPLRRSGPPIASRHQVTAHAGLVVHPTPRLGLQARVSPGAEFVRWRANGGAGVRTLATAAVEGLVHIALAGRWYAQLAVGANATLNRFAFIQCEAGPDPCTGARRRVVLTPWRVRPRVQVGIGLHF